MRISASVEAEAALSEMVKRYPVARTEIEPRVFVRATDNYLELAARFVVPVRQARWYNDEFTRRALARLASAGIQPASMNRIEKKHLAFSSPSPVKSCARDDEQDPRRRRPAGCSRMSTKRRVVNRRSFDARPPLSTRVVSAFAWR